MITTEHDIAKNLEELELLKFKLSEVDCACNREGCKVHLYYKKKYIYVDVGSSGRFLIDLGNDCVYTIKAYGQKNRLVGSVEVTNNKLIMDIDAVKLALQKKEQGKSICIEVNF